MTSVCVYAASGGRFQVHEGYQDGILYYWVLDMDKEPADWLARFPYGLDGLSNAKYFADCKRAA